MGVRFTCDRCGEVSDDSDYSEFEGWDNYDLFTIRVAREPTGVDAMVFCVVPKEGEDDSCQGKYVSENSLEYDLDNYKFIKKKVEKDAT